MRDRVKHFVMNAQKHLNILQATSRNFSSVLLERTFSTMYLSNNIVTAYQWKQNFVKIQPISSANHQKKLKKSFFGKTTWIIFQRR